MFRFLKRNKKQEEQPTMPNFAEILASIEKLSDEEKKQIHEKTGEAVADNKDESAPKPRPKKWRKQKRISRKTAKIRSRRKTVWTRASPHRKQTRVMRIHKTQKTAWTKQRARTSISRSRKTKKICAPNLKHSNSNSRKHKANRAKWIRTRQRNSTISAEPILTKKHATGGNTQYGTCTILR